MNNANLLRRRRTAACLSFLLVAFCAGCGKARPPILAVEGIVRLDGVPLNNVEVRFIPAGPPGAEYMARGVTDKDGKFKLMCKGQAGAYAGDNHVLIREAEIPAHLKSERAQLELANYLQSLGGRPLPEKYTDLGNNPLIVNVNAEQTEYELPLTRGP